MHETLAKLREGLHISASSLKSFLTCPWKFKLQYVEGAQPEFRASALILGKAVHEAIAVYHRSVQTGQAVDAVKLTSQYDEAFTRELQGEIPVEFKDKESAETLRETGKNLVSLYQRESQLQKILAVEQPFCAELVDPRSGELLEPTLIGVFDLVEEDDEGTVSVVEIKTASKRWSAGQVNLDLQGSLYAEAVAQAGLVEGDQEALIRYEFLIKNKTPVLDRQYAVRRPGDRERARLIAVDCLKAIEHGSFFRNPGVDGAGQSLVFLVTCDLKHVTI